MEAVVEKGEGEIEVEVVDVVAGDAFEGDGSKTTPSARRRSRGLLRRSINRSGESTVAAIGITIEILRTCLERAAVAASAREEPK